MSNFPIAIDFVAYETEIESLLFNLQYASASSIDVKQIGYATFAVNKSRATIKCMYFILI